MPAIEETETGAKTMPTPRPRLRSPGSSSTAYREFAGAAATSPAATATRTNPEVATARGLRWASRWRATMVPTVMATAKGRKATPFAGRSSPARSA